MAGSTARPNDEIAYGEPATAVRARDVESIVKAERPGMGVPVVTLLGTTRNLPDGSMIGA